MNKHEFDDQWRKVIKARFEKQQKLDWHSFVLVNLYRLSDEALDYIVQNDDNYFFGQWLVQKAVDIRIFEKYVLENKNEQR